MNFRIPLFDLNFNDAEEKAVVATLRSKWISTGPKTSEFENKFSSLFNVKHSVALSNCTVALHLAMKICGIKEGDEVICPSLTFVATVNAIRYVGAIPVFADIISRQNLTINPADIECMINSKTAAIVVMHYGGFACDMDQILLLAKKYNLKVIEDACHAPLSLYQNKKLGTLGDIGCFSFFSNKNISTGEGGMLVTNRTEYFERAKLLRSHGMTSLAYERSKGHASTYDVVDLGYNYRMDDIRATLGIVQLDKLLNDLYKREYLRKIYIEELCDLEDILIPFKDYKEFSSNYIFTIVLKNSTEENRERIRNGLSDFGIQTSVHYPAVHKFSIYKNYLRFLPNTEYVSDNLITLPMYSNLSTESIKFIVASLKRIIKC